MIAFHLKADALVRLRRRIGVELGMGYTDYRERGKLQVKDERWEIVALEAMGLSKYVANLTAIVLCWLTF